MNNIKKLKAFLESSLNYDDVDYHGIIMKAKKTQDREQRKLELLTKIEQLDEILRSIGLIIQDLDGMEINTERLQKLYYELASIIKSIEE